MEKTKTRKYRIIILGAGFSRLAGLPLGDELWTICLRRAKLTILYENKLKYDIKNFIEYKYYKTGIKINESNINLEEFFGFLDIEHFLGLKGSDTMTSTGNESQHLLKNIIAEEIHNKQSVMSKFQWDAYEQFASNLLPGDTVITLNYDTILENALERINKKYRLFPQRYESVHLGGAYVDQNSEDVIILKLHGSIDWFDYTPMIEFEEYVKKSNSNYKPTHPIFSNPKLFNSSQIIDGPRHEDDILKNIYRAKNLEFYFNQTPSVTTSPLILAPSFSKILYINPLKSFLFGMNGYGNLNFGLNIIGFSLPSHDEYLYQILYRICTNYQKYNQKIFELRKTKVNFVNFAKDNKSKESLYERFRFLNWKKTNCFWNGFEKDIIKKLFK
ncbi:MAG: SIR2 family protein [Leptospira sp.]|uniref:SIR2 family protein n=1 Tax=Leptospira sp. TaxID=178 RepID=UPI0025C06B11|nr:SIR2 family protein [Leptospira sp.]MBL0956574.1 SIR2 family protein [Leptospira sp.]